MPRKYGKRRHEHSLSELKSAGKTGAVIQLRREAVEILAAQPTTLVGLSQEERDRIVVTAVADADGKEYVVSRFGDSVWDLSSLFKAKNQRILNRFTWPDDVPKALVNDAKAALYCAMRGAKSGTTWSGRTALNCGSGAVSTLRHLTSLGLVDFSQVKALHLMDYVNDLSEVAKLSPDGAFNRVRIIDLVWQLHDEVFHPLTEHPFGGISAWEACGVPDDRAGAPSGVTGKTPVIPLKAQRQLFEYCEARLDEADALLDRRDAGELPPTARELIKVRDAVLYVLGVTGAMRNSEATETTNGCWREEVRNGVTFYWVTTREHKTTGGKRLDYLVPREALRGLEILQRYAEPLQARLAQEAAWMEQMLRDADASGVLPNGMTVIEGIARLNYVREIASHLFLGVDSTKSDHQGTGSRVGVLSNLACNLALRSLAKAAGVEWYLTTHQLRRTWAWNIANSRMGYRGLAFIKWQLKHASIAWSQLYGANPHQDVTVYDDIHEAMVDVKVLKLGQWHEVDARLSGGAGKELMQTRGTPVRSMKQLLVATAEAITIRNTGHSWCLSETRDCGGQGVYEPAMCKDCKRGVIDREQGEMWQQIHLENRKLASITDCGLAVSQRAERAIKASEEVLSDLGVALPSEDQARAYLAALESPHEAEVV